MNEDPITRFNIFRFRDASLQLKSVAAFWFPGGAGREIRMISGSFGI